MANNDVKMIETGVIKAPDNI